MNRSEAASEPSMDDILASIRKIIAEEPAAARPAAEAPAKPLATTLGGALSGIATPQSQGGLPSPAAPQASRPAGPAATGPSSSFGRAPGAAAQPAAAMPFPAAQLPGAPLAGAPGSAVTADGGGTAPLDDLADLLDDVPASPLRPAPASSTAPAAGPREPSVVRQAEVTPLSFEELLRGRAPPSATAPEPASAPSQPRMPAAATPADLGAVIPSQSGFAISDAPPGRPFSPQPIARRAFPEMREPGPMPGAAPSRALEAATAPVASPASSPAPAPGRAPASAMTQSSPSAAPAAQPASQPSAPLFGQRIAASVREEPAAEDRAQRPFAASHSRRSEDTLVPASPESTSGYEVIAAMPSTAAQPRAFASPAAPAAAPATTPRGAPEPLPVASPPAAPTPAPFAAPIAETPATASPAAGPAPVEAPVEVTVAAAPVDVGVPVSVPVEADLTPPPAGPLFDAAALESTAAAASALGALAAGLAASSKVAAAPAVDTRPAVDTGPSASGPLAPAEVATAHDAEPETLAPAPAPSRPASAQVAAETRTLEDTVAELLRPMLRQWLADNMPRIVEKALKIELAESVRRAPGGDGKPPAS